MNTYLFQAAYYPEAWAAMIKDPQNRLEKVSAAVKNLGGKTITGYLSLGDQEIIAIMEFPDNEAAIAVHMAFMAGGSTKSLKITPIISLEDGVKCMTKAAGIGYVPVGKK